MQLFGSFEIYNQPIHRKPPHNSRFHGEGRKEGSSVQTELQTFIGYRNEAAHKKVENLLSRWRNICCRPFYLSLGHALADLVKYEIYRRHVVLKHYSLVCKIVDTHYGGKIVVGIPDSGVNLKVGDEIIIWGEKICRPATIESIRLDGTEVAKPWERFARNRGSIERKGSEGRRITTPNYSSGGSEGNTA